MAVDERGNIFVAGSSNSSNFIDEVYSSCYGFIDEMDISDPPSLTFPGVLPGANSAEQTVTLTNSGNAPLTIASINISTNFDLDASASTSCQTGEAIAAGANCTLTVYSSPTSTGALSGQLTLTDNALNAAPATQTIALSGFGQLAQAITFSSNQITSITGASSVSLLATASSGLAVTFSMVSGPGTIIGNTLIFTAPGTVVVAANQAGNNSYAAAPTVTISIPMTQASQVITFNQPTTPVTYGVTPITLSGSSNVGLPVAFSVLSGPGMINANTLTITAGGTVMVAANQAGVVGIAAAAQVTQSVVVNLAAQTISFPQPATPVTYGAPVTLRATANSHLAVSYSVVSGPATVTNNTVATTGVGVVVVAANQTGNSGYTAATQVTRSFGVSPAVLTATAPSPSIVYGAPLPTYTASITGYVNKDSSTVISGAPTFYTTPATPSAVGSYPIIMGTGTLAAANYSFTLVNGTLTIGKAAATVSGTSDTVVCGQTRSIPVTFAGQFIGTGIALPSGTADYTIANPGGTVASGTLTLTAGSAGVSVPSTLAIGNYTVTVSYGGDGNYNAATGTVALAVTAMPVSQTITFLPLTSPITYGVSPITLSATATSGLPVTFSLYPNSPAILSGNTLTITGAGTVKVAANQAGNSIYAAALEVDESIAVNPAVLTVTAASPSIVYGAAIPTYSAGVSGFVNSKDSSTAVIGAPTLTTSPAVPSSAAGSYPIIVGKGTLVASNYAFTLVNGTLTIGKATVTMSGSPATVASGQTKSIPVTFAGQYLGTGIAPPSGPASYTIVNQAGAVASGTLTLTAGSASVSVPSILASGSYMVQISYGGDGNYSAATGTIALTVTAKQTAQTITFTPPSSPVTYGVAPITQKATASSGLAITFSVVSGPAAFSGGTLTITGAGTVKVAANQAGNSNYTAAVQVTGSIVVNPAVLTVTANSPAIVYGAALPTYTAGITGYVNKDSSTVVSGAPTLTTSPSAPSAVGSYPITAGKGTLTAANYTFTFVKGSLSITKAPLTITATSLSVAYNQPLPKLAYTVAGFVNKDTPSVLSGSPAESTTAKQGSAPAAYPITIAQGTLAAANYGFQFQNGALTVTSLGTATAPVFTPAASTYSTSQTVKISAATAGSVFYYTINATPTSSSTKYTSAGIKVSATETIEAINIAPGYSNSAVASAQYVIATVPAVTTGSATALSTSGATLNASVSANNATTQYWFAWSTSKSALTTTTTKSGALTGTTSSAVSATLTGLKTKTTYYYQSFASNAAGSTPGTVLSFTTN